MLGHEQPRPGGKAALALVRQVSTDCGALTLRRHETEWSATTGLIHAFAGITTSTPCSHTPPLSHPSSRNVCGRPRLDAGPPDTVPLGQEQTLGAEAVRVRADRIAVTGRRARDRLEKGVLGLGARRTRRRAERRRFRSRAARTLPQGTPLREDGLGLT